MQTDKHKEKLDWNNTAKRLVTTQRVDDIKTIWKKLFHDTETYRKTVWKGMFGLQLDIMNSRDEIDFKKFCLYFKVFS
jgi:hypothetical protein